jgi:iron complex outermembrane receptor protein
MTSKYLLLAAIAALAQPLAPANAADAAEAANPTPGDAATAHRDADQAIIITGVSRRSQDALGGVSVVDIEELSRDVRPSIGETLQSQPGVTASSFGPVASRPILRGLSGERVRILVDGIGSLDLSASDPDHAVAINPLTAERIEVLRGPSALLFGSSAIGGVVNVIDTRIPRHMPDGPVQVNALAEYGSAANERSANGSVDVPLGGNFVGHLDASYSKFDDLHVGGYLLSPELREEAEASPDPAVQELAELKDKLPNTSGRIDDIAGGLAYVDGDLNVGLSFNHHDAKYGVPIRFSLDPEIVPEAPTIDAHQNRGDLRVTVPVGGWFTRAELRGGISKYWHNEIEDSGEIGSRFFSNGQELRGDVVQTDRGGWGGTSGLQYLHQTARIRGEEKYLPDSDNRQFGLFTLQSFVSGKFRVEGGARVEFSRVDADADEAIAKIADEFAEGQGEQHDIGHEALSRSFTPLSLSIGGSYEIAPGWRAGLSLSHSERSPAIDELYSFGPHGGSQQFLVGNPDLSKEKSNGAEISLHHTTGPVHLQGSLYYSRFSSFIFQAPTGEIQAASDGSGLPIYEYRQAKAKYYGFELEADAKFGQALGIRWGGELVTDYVHATIDDFGPAPQIPPFRILGALTGSRGQVDGRLEVESVSGQDRVAPNETETPGFTMVNASVDWHPFAANPELTLSLQGNNLFDVNARRHSSILKDYAPLAGRDIRISARMAF